MFTRAIVRTPGKSLIHGLTSAELGAPDYNKALVQHRAYIDVLKNCGLEVLVLEADEHFPDSTFVEDVALLTPSCAILTNPGAPSRKGEVDGMKKVLDSYYDAIEKIVAPGTIEAGDIMMVGSHFYIGLSERTNEQGAQQMIDILQNHGMTGSTVRLEKVLHLKTGLAYLENNNLVACGEFLTKPEFEQFNKIEIPESESYAANCIWVNGTVIIPSGHPTARDRITEAGYPIFETDMSEFQKLDGGLSCLSLRF
jgi:dimethylargininase